MTRVIRPKTGNGIGMNASSLMIRTGPISGDTVADMYHYQEPAIEVDELVPCP